MQGAVPGLVKKLASFLNCVTITLCFLLLVSSSGCSTASPPRSRSLCFSLAASLASLDK